MCDECLSVLESTFRAQRGTPVQVVAKAGPFLSPSETRIWACVGHRLSVPSDAAGVVMPEESLPSAFPCPCARPQECRSPVPLPSRRQVLSLLPLLALGCVSVASGAAVVPNPFVPPPAFPSWAPPLLSARPILIATARYNQRYPSLDIPSQSGSRYARPAVGLPQQSFFGQGGRQRSLVCSASTSQGLGGRFFGALKRGAGQGRGDSQVGHSLRSTGSLTGRAGSMEDSSLHRMGGPRNALPPGTTPPDRREVVATAAGESPKAGGVRAKPGSGGKKKVLILMSDTGGGHRASAQALESAFDELFPNQVRPSLKESRRGGGGKKRGKGEGERRGEGLGWWGGERNPLWPACPLA